MSAVLQLDDNREWTPDDLAELPEHVDWRRFEIVDGALVVSPSAAPSEVATITEPFAAEIDLPGLLPD